jgi:hypothetical protein
VEEKGLTDGVEGEEKEGEEVEGEKKKEEQDRQMTGMNSRRTMYRCSEGW